MRLALVLSCLVLAAACGGDSPTHVDAGAEPPDGEQHDAGASCGDGVVNFDGETCDDANVESGDGCSESCEDERCGDGIINDVDETCDDAEATPDGRDGCDASCTLEPGFLCTGEPTVCLYRDGSCAAPLLFAGSSMSGDTTGGGDDVVAAACDGIDSGGGADHVYELALTGGDDVVILLEPAFDGLVRLLAAPCDLLTEVAEPGQPEGCADFNGTTGDEVLRYTNLAAGTYYVAVDGFEADDVGGYTLTVAATDTLCGNGAIDGDEACDDGGTAVGDGCGPTCQEEPGYTCTGEPSVCAVSCGNGEIDDPTEECDDGNPTNGDRCSTACVLESTVSESEPNDDDATADVVVASSVVRGAIGAGELDVYAFTTAVPVILDLELYTTVNGDDSDYTGGGTLDPVVDCDADLDLRIFGTADLTTGGELAYDDFDGDGDCAHLGPSTSDELMVQPGTYYIVVQGYDSSVVAPLYALDVAVTAASAPTVDGLIINEFLASDSGVDANCDGDTSNEEDEFVELYNASASFVTLAGVTVADAGGVNHTFSALGVRPGEAAVVFSGGTASCAAFDGVVVEISDTALSLNNSNDTITVASAAATPLATVSYTTTGAGISKNLTTDATDTVVGTTTGVFVNHDAILAGTDASPGTRVDGTAW